jgi:hypothetical protein
MIDGTKEKVDGNYVLNSIWYPEKHIVAGYGPVSKMNSFKGILDQKDVDYVIAYLKELKNPTEDAK